MKVTMMLANHVEVQNGLFYIHGGGWSVTGPGPVNFGLGVLVEVPWDKTNLEHGWRLTLVDSDGQPVMVEGEEGEQPLVEIANKFEVGRPPGVKAGTPLPVSLAFDFHGLPLPAGDRYRFELWVDGEVAGDVAFSTRPAPEPSE